MTPTQLVLPEAGFFGLVSAPMLEQMRESTGSFVIWILFAVIIAAFVLFFGSPADSLGCGSSNKYTIEVGDTQVSENSWRFAYQGVPYITNQNIPAEQRKPLVFELLIEREILAQAAEEMDFQVPDSMIDDAIKFGDFYILGRKLDGSRFYFTDGFFDFEYFERRVGDLGSPAISSYKLEQRREMLAYFVRQELLQSATVSDEEAKHNFIASNTTVSAKYVKFDTARYRSELSLSEVAVQEYAGSHETELKEEWEQVKPRWENDKDRLKARILKIAKVETPEAAAKEEKAEGEETPEPVPTETIDEARVAIDAAREEIAGGADFATVAKDKSDDRSSTMGGMIGWRSATSIGYGPEIVKAAKDLEIGKVSEVVETERAYFLIVVEERSDKGLTFEQKKLDLAVKLAPNTVALSQAKQAAENALARAKASSLDEIFKAATPRAPLDTNSLPPEILEQLSPEDLQKLMQGAKIPGSESGALVTEGRTQFAQLGESEDPAPTAEAKPSAPKEALVEAKPVPVSPAAEEIPVDGSEEIAVVDFGVEAPELQLVTRSTRNKSFIAGIGSSKKLVGDLFEKLAIGSLSSEVYELKNGEGYVIVQLSDRSEADMEQFQEQAAGLKEALAQDKGLKILQRFVADRCVSMREAGEIKPNYALLRTSDNKQLPYTPCEQLTATQ